MTGLFYRYVAPLSLEREREMRTTRTRRTRESPRENSPDHSAERSRAYVNRPSTKPSRVPSKPRCDAKREREREKTLVLCVPLLGRRRGGGTRALGSGSRPPCGLAPPTHRYRFAFRESTSYTTGRFFSSRVRVEPFGQVTTHSSAVYVGSPEHAPFVTQSLETRLNQTQKHRRNSTSIL